MITVRIDYIFKCGLISNTLNLNLLLSHNISGKGSVAFAKLY